MLFEGIVKGKVIILKGDQSLPEGTEVEITVKKMSSSKKGSPSVLLSSLLGTALLEEGDIDELKSVIQEGRCDTNWESPFGEEEG